MIAGYRFNLLSLIIPPQQSRHPPLFDQVYCVPKLFWSFFEFGVTKVVRN